MFKRKGRILFLDPGDGTRARMAEGWARELGARWLETGCAVLGEGCPEPALVRVMAEAGAAARDEPCPLWDPGTADRWDLVVLLAVDREEVPAGLGGARLKRWDMGAVGAGSKSPDLRACREVLRDRVSGLVGGFRLKAREDPDQ